MANKFMLILEQIQQSINQSRHYKQIMTIDEVSRYTGFSKSYIYKLCCQRLLPYYKPIGKTLFFKRSELEQFLLSDHYPSIDMMYNNYKNKNLLTNKNFKK